jgi:hypothetical protein
MQETDMSLEQANANETDVDSRGMTSSVFGLADSRC